MLKIPESAYIAPSATVAGDVTMGEDCSVYFNASIRGDVYPIKMGDRCNVQDNCVLHGKVEMGDGVSVGHGAIVHSCKIGNNVLVGMGAIVMSGAEIGDNCIIGAGSLVTGRTVIPPMSLVMGSPAKVVRQMTEKDIAMVERNCEIYLGHRRDFLDGKWEFYKHKDN